MRTLPKFREVMLKFCRSTAECAKFPAGNYTVDVARNRLCLSLLFQFDHTIFTFRDSFTHRDFTPAINLNISTNTSHEISTRRGANANDCPLLHVDLTNTFDSRC